MLGVALSTAAAGEVRVVFLGDSLTAGYGLPPDEAFPARIEAALREEGREVVCINAGLSGDTAAGGLRRLDWLLREPVDVLVLALGANDALRGFPLDHTEASLTGILDEVRTRQPDADVLLAGMYAPPNLGRAYGEAFAAMYRRLAEHPAVDGFLPFLLDGVGGVPELNQADGIHPTAAGQQRLADHVLPHLTRIIHERCALINNPPNPRP